MTFGEGGDFQPDFTGDKSHVTVPPTEIDIHMDALTLIYSSGATGKAKGVMLSHANMLYALISQR